VIAASFVASLLVKAWTEVAAARADAGLGGLGKRAGMAAFGGAIAGLFVPAAFSAFVAVFLGLRVGLGCGQVRMVYLALGVSLLAVCGAKVYHFYATSQGQEFRQRMGWAGEMVAILNAVFLALGLLPLAAAIATGC
jgi:hypothetical protein